MEILALIVALAGLIVGIMQLRRTPRLTHQRRPCPPTSLMIIGV